MPSVPHVVLVDPPLSPQPDTDLSSYPNMGFLSLISAARKFVPNCRVEYIQRGRQLSEWVRELVDACPDVVGLSFATMMAPQAYAAAAALRNAMPGVLLIAGGPHPTIAPEEVLSKSEIDLCCVGEGEITFCEILEALSAAESCRPLGGEFRQIAGIAFKQDGQVIINERRPFLHDLNELPMPAWDLVHFERYEGSNYRKASPDTCILASRGCPYQCTFCSNPVWRYKRPSVRSRSPESIAREVEYLYGRGIREIYIRSDEINFDLRWAKRLTAAIAELGHKDLWFQCNLRGDKVDDELAAGLAEMNCWMVHIGVESANQRVPEGIGKHIHVDQVVHSCEVLRRHGIFVYAFLMMYQVWEENGRLCFETPDEVDHTLAFAARMFRRGVFQYMSWQFATPLPGAAMWDIAQKYGIRVPSAACSMWEISVDLPGVSRKRMLWQRRRGMALQSYWAFRNGGYNWRMWRRIVRKLAYILLPSSASGRPGPLICEPQDQLPPLQALSN